jgi:asparagine synthase (glutamine-hydrolysing)
MLAGSAGLPEWTFYEGVRRLPPGHTLVVDERGARVREHASFGRRDAAARSADDYADDLRAHLTEAVRVRLDVSATPGLLLSGGLDSISIAGIAGALGRARSTTPALRTYSFAYDDLMQCDERHVSGIVAKHYGFQNTPIPASDAWPLAGHPAHGPAIDGPDRFRSHVLLARSLDLARQDGVKVLMTGQRGDALLGGGVVDYLGRLRDDGPLVVWRDLARHSARSGRSRRSLIERHVLRRVLTVAWPQDRAAATRQRLRRVGACTQDEFPIWLRREAIDRFSLRDIAAQAVPRSRLRGEARRRRHLRMLDPKLGRNTEAMERTFAQAGIRYVDPWADSRLADLVLRIPQYLITPAGEPKWLLREAMRGILPEAARLAATKRSPQPLYDRGLADRASGVVLSLIDHSVAASRGYVDEDAVRAAYARIRAEGSRVTGREWRHLWRFIDVEDWLRRYHS